MAYFEAPFFDKPFFNLPFFKKPFFENPYFEGIGEEVIPPLARATTKKKMSKPKKNKK